MIMGYNILGEKIIEQMKQVKEERRHLERVREELIRKVEKLYEESKLKRCHGKVYCLSLVTVKETSFTELILFNIYYFAVMV